MLEPDLIIEFLSYLVILDAPSGYNSDIWSKIYKEISEVSKVCGIFVLFKGILGVLPSTCSSYPVTVCLFFYFDFCVYHHLSVFLFFQKTYSQLTR